MKAHASSSYAEQAAIVPIADIGAAHARGWVGLGAIGISAGRADEADALV